MARYRIAYIATCLLALLTFLGTNQPAAFGALALLAVLALVCLLSSVALSRALKVEYSLGNTCVHDEELLLRIDTRRPPLVPGGNLKITLEVRSVAWDETHRYEVFLSPGLHRAGSYAFRCPTADCGKMEVQTLSVVCMGPLHLIAFPLNKPFSGSYLVQPQLHDMAISLERAPRARFEGTTYDHTHRGQDASETFDIREYQPGDPLRAVHWKLSSKLDDMLVREASQPSNYDTLLLFDAARTFADGSPASYTATKAAYDLCASVSLAMFRSGLAHDIAYLGDELLEDHEVDSPRGFADALEGLLCTPMPRTGELFADAVAHHGYRHNYTKIVMIATELNTNLALTLGRTHDLSVVLVPKHGAQATEQNDVYGVVSVPADAVPSIRTLSI